MNLIIIMHILDWFILNKGSQIHENLNGIPHPPTFSSEVLKSVNSIKDLKCRYTNDLTGLTVLLNV